MKLQKLIIIMIVVSVQNCLAMDAPKIGWSNLPATAVLQVIAQLPDKQTLVLVDKKISKLASKKNTDTLLQWPCVLSRKHHIECMVKYAKADHSDRMRCALASAPLCGHDDAVDVLFYFMSRNSSQLGAIADYQKNPMQDVLEQLLPYIMAVYKGSDVLCSNYINKYESDLLLRPHIQPLILAAREDHRSVAELLLTQIEPRAKKTIDLKYFFTPLHMAVFCNRLEMVKIILQYPFIDINAQDSDGCSAIMYAASEGYGAIVQYLIDKKANVNIAMQGSFATPLHAAVGNGIVDILTMLLAVDPMVDSVNDNNETPLYTAVFNRMSKMVHMLLKAGADPNIPDMLGKTPLHVAVDTCNTDVVSFLLQKRALIDMQNKKGETPLMLAVNNSNALVWWVNNKQANLVYLSPKFALIELLLKAKADPNKVDTQGNTALMLAVCGDNLAIADLLLKFGADPRIRNLKGKKAADLARSSGMKKRFKDSNNCIIS